MYSTDIDSNWAKSNESIECSFWKYDMMVNVSLIDESTTDMSVAAAAAEATSNICIIEQNN